MKIENLKIGDTFYFPGNRKSMYVFMGFTFYESGNPRQGKAVPTGKLMPMVFGLNKEVIVVNISNKTNNMIYPVYKKNGGRYTCIINQKLFIEVHQLKTVSRISTGENMNVVQDAIINDVDCTEKEFNNVLNSANVMLTMTRNEATLVKNKIG